MVKQDRFYAPSGAYMFGRRLAIVIVEVDWLSGAACLTALSLYHPYIHNHQLVLHLHLSALWYLLFSCLKNDKFAILFSCRNLLSSQTIWMLLFLLGWVTDALLFVC